MNSKKGFREAKGDFLRVTAGAAVLIVTTMSTTLWAGSAMAASDSDAPSASSSQPAMVGGPVSVVGLDLTVAGVVVAVLVVALTVDYGRRRIARRRAGGRRGGTHAKTPGLKADGAIETVTEPFTPAARPELALPVRVRRDFAPGGNRTSGADRAPQPGPMPPRGVELAVPGSGMRVDQGPDQPDAPEAHEHLHKP